MTEKELYEWHLIAKFMGGQRKQSPFMGDGYIFSGDAMDNPKYGTGFRFMTVGGAKFNTWQYIMLVCAKIKELGVPEDEQGILNYNDVMQGITGFFDAHITCMDVVRYIEHYNLRIKTVD